MTASMVQLVLHYDGADFAGWQRQPGKRTVQGVLEEVLERLCDMPVKVVGAGRTDSGVHARGQAASVRVPARWDVAKLRQAANALLPADIWVAAALEMRPDFHARYAALSRVYSYRIGTDEEARSPFRCRYEWLLARTPPDQGILSLLATGIEGRHSFRGFAVRGTAPEGDDHVCCVQRAAWRARQGGLVFEIEANRFLHHMVRFLVGSMVEAATGRRTAESVLEMLTSADNSGVSPPAPAHALFLERVTYPRELYLHPL